MSEDILAQVALAAWSLVLSWLYLAKRDELSAMKSDISKANAEAEAASAAAAAGTKALDSHRLYASETFARRVEVKEALQETEARLKEALVDTEERLTETQEKLGEKLDDIRDRLPPKPH